MFRHLLVPIDGSERSLRAATTAIGLAQQVGASVTALVVEQPSPPSELGHGVVGMLQRQAAHDLSTAAHAERLLALVKARAAAAGVTCDGCYARSDRIVPAILDAARACGCDLIVMATHVHGALSEWLTPSHTKGVMAHGKLPLLVVH